MSYPKPHEKFQGHPFGCENEVSVRQLFTFFCNSLYLGQWELARACVAELHQQKDLLQIDICAILRNIAENPYGYRLVDIYDTRELRGTAAELYCTAHISN